MGSDFQDVVSVRITFDAALDSWVWRTICGLITPGPSYFHWPQQCDGNYLKPGISRIGKPTQPNKAFYYSSGRHCRHWEVHHAGGLQELPPDDIIAEPVGEWTNFNGTDVLNLLMTNPHRWATTQEFLAYNSMINEHLRRLGLVKAMERSIHSARLCFAEVLKTEGKISDAEYAILDYWYKFLINKEAKYPTGFDTEADIIIYLQTTPEVANQRINGRGRSEESTIQMSYLEHLHEAHENWLIRGTSGFDVPAKRVLVLNTDHPLEFMMGVYHKLAEKIWATIPKDLKSICTS